MERDLEPRVITNSELRCFQSCKRKWYIGYYLELTQRPGTEATAGVMHLGSAIHFALEAHYGHNTDPFDALDWVYETAIAENPAEEAELTKEYKLAEVMLDGYLKWVASEGIDASVDIIGTEVPVSYELDVGNEHPVTIRGRFDQLVRRKSDGAVVIRDLKTVGGLGKAQQLRLGSQLKFYALLQSLNAKASGQPAAAAGEYLLILRSKRTDRATPPFYDKVEVPLNRHDLNAQYMMTVSIVQDIEATRRLLDLGWDHHKVAYPHFTDACNYSCPFKNVCPLMDDGSRYRDMLNDAFIKHDTLSYYSDDKMRAMKAALAIQ